MNTVIDVASVVVFIVLIMYAAIKLDEAAKKLRSEEERIYRERRKMKRGFEKAKGYEFVNLPQKNKRSPAGYNIESAVDVVIEPGETKEIETGLKVNISGDKRLGIYINSILAFDHGLILTDCVGVADNEEHIVVTIRNISEVPYRIRKGDRIAQGIFYDSEELNEIKERIYKDGWGRK